MSLADICSCDDGDPPYFYQSDVRRSRKIRSCEECGGRIQAGQFYQNARGSWQRGEVDTFETCERCLDILTWLKNNIPCFCYAHGGAFEGVVELLHEAQRLAPDETRGLLFGYHRRIALRDRYNKAARAVQ